MYRAVFRDFNLDVPHHFGQGFRDMLARGNDVRGRDDFTFVI
jgi:hypothetical protein